MTREQAIATVKGRSWLSEARLRALWDSVSTIINDGVPGAVVECGCATGGSAALLGLALRGRRKLYIFDGFQGLPEPSERDPDRAKAQRFVGHCHCSQAEVEAYLSGLGVEATIVPGMYADTHPADEPSEIALLHVDCDFHDSVLLCLESFFYNVSWMWRIHIDDYGHWAGCKTATDKFITAQGYCIEDLIPIDGTGVYLFKRDVI